MLNVQLHDTEHGQIRVAATTKPDDLAITPKKRSLHLRFPNDHKYKLSPHGDTQLLLSRDAVKALGKPVDDIHKDMLRQSMDLSTLWERWSTGWNGNVTQAGATWKYSNCSLQWSTNGFVHIKDVVYRIISMLNASGVKWTEIDYRWIRYPADLRSSGLASADVNAVDDDYSINIRDRSSNMLTYQYQPVIRNEYRFNGFRLKPDEKVDLWLRTRDQSVTFDIDVTAHYREMEKGGF